MFLLCMKMFTASTRSQAVYDYSANAVLYKIKKFTYKRMNFIKIVSLENRVFHKITTDYLQVCGYRMFKWNKKF